MAKVNRRKDGSWQSRRSAESRQVDEGYHAWLKRRKAEGKSVPNVKRPGARFGYSSSMEYPDPDY